jgi:hypothetical protein
LEQLVEKVVHLASLFASTVLGQCGLAVVGIECFDSSKKFKKVNAKKENISEEHFLGYLG